MESVELFSSKKQKSDSYDQVHRINTAIAKLMHNKFVKNGNVPIPSSIVPVHFFQFFTDNIDIIKETLDLKDTFQATQMVVFQRGKHITMACQ